MAISTRIEARNQSRVLFFAFLAITLFFTTPQFKNYLTGQKWIEVNVKPRKNNKEFLLTDSIHKGSSESRLVVKQDIVLEVPALKTWGIYFFIRELADYIFLFFCLWYLLKVMNGIKSEDSFENATSSALSKLGNAIILIAIISFLDRLFINFYVLRELNYSGFKLESSSGNYLLVGVLIIYLSRYYKKGLSLKKENDLTI